MLVHISFPGGTADVFVTLGECGGKITQITRSASLTAHATTVNYCGKVTEDVSGKMNLMDQVMRVFLFLLCIDFL